MRTGEIDGRTTLTAMLLAGGQSQRMGFDKATLTIAGEPLWQRQLRVLRELPPETLWVSAREAPKWCPTNIEVILDDQPSRGPLSALAAGLRWLRTSHLVVLAIDLPLVSVEHLRKLCSLARPGSGVIPRQSDYFEPLCAVYPAEAAATAQAALRSEDVSLQNFSNALLDQARAEAYPLTAGEGDLYLNVNRPDDLAVVLSGATGATSDPSQAPWAAGSVRTLRAGS